MERENSPAYQTAIVIEEAGRSVFRDIAPDGLGSDDVRVKLAFVGLCGSDINTYIGKNPLVSLPRIPGHEASGTIVELGKNVGPELALGQKVILWPYTSCGTCTACKKGRANACKFNETLGVQRDGALKETIVVPATKVIPNEPLSSKHQVLVEPLSVGFHAVARGQVTTGEIVAVIGCGMIGLGAIIAAADRGARVIAIDPMKKKGDIALKFGATHFLTETGEALRLKINELTAGNGVDTAIEAVGLPETFTAAVDLAGYGGKVVYVGYCKAPVTYNSSLFNLKELDILGSRNAQRSDFDAVIKKLNDLGPLADDLISRVLPFSEADTAFSYWFENRSSVLKIVVEL